MSHLCRRRENIEGCITERVGWQALRRPSPSFAFTVRRKIDTKCFTGPNVFTLAGMSKRNKPKWFPYLGWVLIALAIFLIFDGQASTVNISLLCGVAALYFLFGTPMQCGAPTRDYDGCRRNSYGIVRGCSIRQHRWRNLKSMVQRKWGQAFSGMMTGPAQKVATMGLMVSVCALVAGVVT